MARYEIPGYEWMHQLIAGSEVILREHGQDRLILVDRVTPTQVHIRGMKFRKADGRELGNEWSRVSVHEATQAAKQAIADRAERRAVETALVAAWNKAYAPSGYHTGPGFPKLTVAQMRAILDIINDGGKGNE